MRALQHVVHQWSWVRCATARAGAGRIARQASTAPLCIAPDKNPKMVRTEVAGNKLLGEFRAQLPQVSWRLLREEGVISTGYQQVLRVLAESSA